MNKPKLSVDENSNDILIVNGIKYNIDQSTNDIYDNEYNIIGNYNNEKVVWKDGFEKKHIQLIDNLELFSDTENDDNNENVDINSEIYNFNGNDNIYNSDNESNQSGSSINSEDELFYNSSEGESDENESDENNEDENNEDENNEEDSGDENEL